MIERFAKINGFPNYEVSDMGYVKNTKTGKKLKPTPGGKNGTLRVTLRDKDKKEQFTLARLVAEAFVGNSDFDLYDLVAHLNGDITDNCYSNLFWTNREGICGQLHNALAIKNRARSSDVKVTVYNGNGDAFEFPKLIDAAKFLNCSYTTVKKYVDTNNTYKGWFIERN